MKSNNIFSQLGTFAADCVQCYRDAYKVARGQWAAEEKQIEELMYLNESKMIDNGFVSNLARVKGLEAKLYKDSMSGKPVESTIASLFVFSNLLEAEERRERALQRQLKRNKAIILEGLLQIVLFGVIAYLTLSFTNTACFKYRRDSAYCQQVKFVQQYFLGSER